MRRRVSRHYTERERMIKQFEVGDYVVPTYMIIGDALRGIVMKVDEACQKVWVAWNGSAVKQHTAEELMLATIPVETTTEKQLTKSQDTMYDIDTSSDPERTAQKPLTAGEMSKVANRVAESFRRD